MDLKKYKQFYFYVQQSRRLKLFSFDVPKVLAAKNVFGRPVTKFLTKLFVRDISEIHLSCAYYSRFLFLNSLCFCEIVYFAIF